MTPYFEKDGITIYHGDALPILGDLPSQSCGLVLTDPPYSSGGFYRGDRMSSTAEKYHQSETEPEFHGDNKDQHAHQYWQALWLTECRRILSDSEVAALFCDWRQMASTIDAVQAAGLMYRGIVVWDKTERARRFPGRFGAQAEFVVWGSRGPRGGDYEWALRGVFPIPAPVGGEREHMTQKPVELMRELVRIAPADGTILDPFMGSGTTLIAARDLGRKAIGIEIEERYCEIAAKRLAQNLLPLNA